MATPKAHIDTFLRQMGLLVLGWNTAEAHVVQLLRRIIADSIAIDILTAHMTAEAKVSALRVCASEMPDSNIKDRLLHAGEYFNTLREWRNHYVHNSLASFAADEDGARGGTRQVKARHTYIVRNESVTASDLERVVVGCRTFNDYANRLGAFLKYQGQDTSNIRHQDGSEISLPEMPPLPLSLEDSRKPLKQQKPSPRSSRK